MPRLPQPGGDAGNWGQILNDYLSVEHNPDGTLKDAARPADLAAKYTKPGGGIPKTDLEQPVKDTLDTVASHTTTLSNHTTTLSQHTTDIAAKANQTDLTATNTRIDTSLKADGTLKDQIVTRGALAGEVGAALTLTNAVAAMGDSNTAFSGNSKTQSDRGYLTWASMLSNGMIRWAGIYATSGFTTAQILATHVPQLLAEPTRPGWCIVLGGTNDVGSDVALATIKINLASIWDRLLAGGVRPIACTIPPLNGSSSQRRSTIVSLNSWIIAQGYRRGIPVIDIFAIVTGTDSNFKAGYTVDGTHLSAAACKDVGAEIVRLMTPHIAPVMPFLTVTNQGDSLGLSNPLFLVDTNGDGYPDGWGRSGGADAGCVVSLATESGAVGNWFRVQTTATPSVIIGPSMTAAVGDVVEFAFRFRCAAPGSGSYTVTFANNAWSVPTAWATQTDACTVAGRFVATAANPYIYISAPASGDMSIAQLTTCNLTALGIA